MSARATARSADRSPVLLVAAPDRVLVVDPRNGGVETGDLPEGSRPTCLAGDPWRPDRAWCGTDGDGVLRTEDGGASWRPSRREDGDAGGGRGEPGEAPAGRETPPGREVPTGREVTSVAASPAARDLVFAGTEPSALWRSADGGETWEMAEGLTDLRSSSEWSFPPRPETHHVRWIAPHPSDPGRLWLAIEAGALVTTPDGGRTWRDRVPGGPYDTHEAAVHPERPDTLRIAAGDGYYESADGGRTWASPSEGLEVGYLRSVAIDPGDPDVVVVSAASRAHAAYVAGRSDGRLYRREGGGAWERVTDGWPDPPETIAPLLVPGRAPGELWAADERGVHRSGDGGRRWERVAAFEETPSHLRGLALV